MNHMIVSFYRYFHQFAFIYFSIDLLYIVYQMLGKDLGLEPDLDKYQKRLNELYKGRKSIVENIKDLAKKQRFMGDRVSKDHSQNKLPINLAKQTSLSSEGLQNLPSGEVVKSQQSISDHHHLDTNQEQIKKVVEIQSGIKDRNRRLFGGLNSHLRKAESKLSEESSKVRSKLTIEERVSQKQKQQSQLFQSQKKKEIEHLLQKLNTAKDNNSKEMLIAENIILKNKFIAYVSDLQHCLYTQTLPSIAWKPTLLNETIMAKQQQGYQSLKNSAKKTIQKIQSYNERFDFSKYRVENERQFYSNYLENFFKSKQHFIRTAVKPSLYWAPASHNDKTKQALQASNQAIQEERVAIIEQNEVFYKRFQKQAIVEEHSEDSESEH